MLTGSIPAQGEAVGKMIRVLILEDDDELRAVLVSVLRKEGYEVVAVSSGEEAVDRAIAEAFDLVVADIKMEGMDGLEALERMREHNPEQRSLVVSGYSTEADSIRAIRMGVGDYLKKPFSRQDFLQAVRRLVAQKREEQNRLQSERSITQTLLWAMETLARSLGVDRAGAEAHRIANQLQMAPEAAERARLVALMAAVEKFPGVTLPAEAPPSIQRILRQVTENWDGSGVPDGLQGTEISLEARVVAVTLADDFEPGRYDPSVWEARENPEVTPSAASDHGKRRRGLISLARALEDAGNVEGARRALEEVALEQAPTRECVEAMAALARIDARKGLVKDALEYSFRSLQLAEQVGPGLMAAALMESGLLLAGMNDSELARTLLTRSARRSVELNEPLGAARATLALAALGDPVDEVEEHLEVLLRPEHMGELAASARWLVPFALERTLPEPLLARLVSELPREVGRALPRLSTGARATVARLTSAPELLERLKVDSESAVRQAATHATVDEGPPLLRVLSMGPLEVYRGEELIDGQWRTQKVKFLFAFLASERGRPVSEDKLLEMFWPDVEDLDKGKQNLYWTISTLRSKLRPAGDKKLDYVVRYQNTLALNRSLPRWHDLEELEDLLDLGARPDAIPDPGKLRRVLELYRGPYLEGCYMDWADLIRTRVERKALALGLRVARWANEQTRFQEGLEFAHLATTLDPCCQDAHHLAMEALIGLGRSEEAVRQFTLCERTLRRELGMEPNLALLHTRQRALMNL